MPGLRIFISHSAKSEAAKALLQELKQSLCNAGHQVLLDQDGLKLGDNWRATLNLWIGGCDAALVLLSEHALQSSFVAYEASILSYRKQIDLDFGLIPIFTESVDYRAVENSLLSPSRIHDIQALINETLPDRIIQRVCDQLTQIDQRITPIEKPLLQLCDLLSQVPEHVLEEQAAELGIDLGGWIPPTDLKRILAAKLLGAGLEKSKDTLRALRSYLLKPKKFLPEMIDLIGSSWVDYRSALRIPEVAKEKKKSLCINGEIPLTAQLYVIRACKHPPRDRWLVATVDNAGGEEFTAKLKEAIEQALCQLFDANDADGLQKALDDYAFGQEPVFVALPSLGVDRDLVRKLRHDFPTVTFFLLAGPKIPEQGLLENAEIEFLRPELEPGSERYYCLQYKQNSTYLMRGL